VHEAAAEAERQAGVSPTAAAFFAGKAVEVAVKWAFRADPSLKLPYQDNISALLHEPSFRRSAGDKVFAKAKYINALRNRAVHEEQGKATGFAEERVIYQAQSDAQQPPSEGEIRADAIKVLQDTVASLSLDNFIVRRRRRVVEKYQKPAAWTSIDAEARDELVEEIAPPPSAKGFGTEEAKRFDLLMFSLQLALLKGSKRFDGLRKQLLEIASALEAQTAIPAIARHAELIEEIQTSLWWEGVTVPLLELVRLRLRDLIQHIEKSKKNVVYSNFADEIGDGVELDMPQVGEADFVRFKQKARHFLKAHEDHIVLHKLRQGRPLTAIDLGELEKMLMDAGVGEAGDIDRARQTSQGFGRFVRSLVGLDRAAVTEAFGEFLTAGTATAAQVEFINMVVEHLTDQGVMEPRLLYEPPFTDIAPTGPDQIFDEERVTRLVAKIRAINESAVA